MSSSRDDRWKLLLLLVVTLVIAGVVWSWLERVWLRNATTDGWQPGPGARALIFRVLIVLVGLALVGILSLMGFGA